jgi:hypothetical protein
MLRLADVKKGDVLYDLGSGDGRIPGHRGEEIWRARRRHPTSTRRIREANGEARRTAYRPVKFRQEDLFKADFREATVVTLYLLPELNERLRPKLWNELKPGTRIVSHQFEMGAWQPEKKIELNGRTIYFWTVPERKK